MPITANEMVAAISDAFDDAESFARAQQRAAIVDDMAEVRGQIANADAQLVEWQNTHGEFVAARQAELAALQAQLDALAGGIE